MTPISPATHFAVNDPWNAIWFSQYFFCIESDQAQLLEKLGRI